MDGPGGIDLGHAVTESLEAEPHVNLGNILDERIVNGAIVNPGQTVAQPLVRLVPTFGLGEHSADHCVSPLDGEVVERFDERDKEEAADVRGRW